jgi:hypothetical protein
MLRSHSFQFGFQVGRRDNDILECATCVTKFEQWSQSGIRRSTFGRKRRTLDLLRDSNAVQNGIISGKRRWIAVPHGEVASAPDLIKGIVR